MAKFNSKASVFNLTDAGGSLRSMEEYVVSIDGIPGERELNEVTVLGDSGRNHIGGLENVTITLELVYDDTATSGPDVVLSGLRSDDTARAWDYGPKGGSGRKYSGTMKLRSYTVMSRVGEIVSARAELLVQGTVTVGTY